MLAQHPYCREAGDGELIVCLHASTSSSRQWRDLMAHMGASHRIIAPDLAGHGRNEWHGDGDAVEEDVRLLDALAGASKAHLVGHSYGGAVALRYALRYPQRVLSLSLYEPAAWHLADDEVRDVGLGIMRVAASGHPEAAARRFIDYWNGAGSFERMESAQQARVVAQMPRVVAHFAALFADATPLHVYATLDAPALLLSGRSGPRCGPQVAEILSDTLPRAGALCLPDLGHMGPISAPARVNGIIARFVEQHVPAKAYGA